jgi:hypothetical protein
MIYRSWCHLLTPLLRSSSILLPFSAFACCVSCLCVSVASINITRNGTYLLYAHGRIWNVQAGQDSSMRVVAQLWRGGVYTDNIVSAFQSIPATTVAPPVGGSNTGLGESASGHWIGGLFVGDVVRLAYLLDGTGREHTCCFELFIAFFSDRLCFSSFLFSCVSRVPFLQVLPPTRSARLFSISGSARCYSETPAAQDHLLT